MTTSLRARQPSDPEVVSVPNEELHSPESQSGTGLPRVLTRWFGPGSGRNTDRFYTVLFVIAVVVVGVGVNLWPDAVPSALLFPVVVGAA